MKVVLVCSYFLVISYSVLASEPYLECHNCLSAYPEHSCKTLLVHQEKSLKQLQFSLGQDIHITEIQCCKGFGPEDPRISIKVAEKDFSCVKVDNEVDYRNGTKLKVAYRGFSKKNVCPVIQRAFDAGKDFQARNGVDVLLDCNECSEDLCNSADTAKISVLLVLMSSGLIFFLQFYGKK